MKMENNQMMLNISEISDSGNEHSENSESTCGNFTHNSLKSTLDCGNQFGINDLQKNKILSRDFNNDDITTYYSPSLSTSSSSAVYTLSTLSDKKDVISTNVGSNFGLSDNVWKTFLETKGLHNLYDWQKECLNMATKNQNNFLFSFPTSSGKTLVAEILIIIQLLCHDLNCIYMLPYVSDVQEKIKTISLLARAFEFEIEEYAEDQGTYPPKKRTSQCILYIATLEKAHGIVNSLLEEGRLKELGLVVVDEIHIIGEGKRGANLEILLCKLLLAHPTPRIVAMSATIGNISEINNFLKADMFTENFRPVCVKEYIKLDNQLKELFDPKERSESHLFVNTQTTMKSTSMNNKNDPDGLSNLVAEVIPNYSCLVFCPSKSNCENVAKVISTNMSKELLEWKKEEKFNLIRTIQREIGRLCPVLETILPFGIAYHHSGLTSDERSLIEEAFASRVLCCLCCTSTLAAGVNLPARRVILRSSKIGDKFMTKSQYQQMIGRSGRTGFDSHGESIMVVKPSELSHVTENILLAEIDSAYSQLLNDNLYGLQYLILNILYFQLGGIMDTQNLADIIVYSTLLGQQIYQDRSARVLVQSCLESLFEKNMVKKDENGDFKIAYLGRATLKGNIDLNLSNQLNSDLREAREDFNLNTDLQLIYLVTPYDSVGISLPLDCRNIFLQAYNTFSDDDLAVASSIGINELVVSKLLKNELKNQVLENRICRFYMALMLRELMKIGSVWEVSEIYKSSRGYVENLLSSTQRFAVCVHQFVQELGELSVFSELLRPLIYDLSLCCSKELIPFLLLPKIDKRKAKLLYKAGFKSLDDIAKSNSFEKLYDCLLNQCNLSKSAVLHLIHAATRYTNEISEDGQDNTNVYTNVYNNSNLSLNETFQSDISDVFID